MFHGSRSGEGSSSETVSQESGEGFPLGTGEEAGAGYRVTGIWEVRGGGEIAAVGGARGIGRATNGLRVREGGEGMPGDEMKGGGMLGPTSGAVGRAEQLRRSEAQRVVVALDVYSLISDAFSQLCHENPVMSLAIGTEPYPWGKGPGYL